MLRDELLHLGDLDAGLELLDADHLGVDAFGEVAALVEHVGDAAGHAGAEVAAGAAEDDDAAAGHVFAAVVADALDDGVDAGVADGEALAGHAAEINLAGGGAVEGDVADDHVVLGLEGGGGGRVDDDLAAGEALADVVVGVALDGERHAARHERAEALAGGPFEVDADGVGGHALGAVLPPRLAAGGGAGDAVDVADGDRSDGLLAPPHYRAVGVGEQE